MEQQRKESNSVYLIVVAIAIVLIALVIFFVYGRLAGTKEDNTVSVTSEQISTPTPANEQLPTPTPANEAERLAHAIEETQRKAEALQQSFNSLSIGELQTGSNRIVSGILAAPLFPQTPPNTDTPTPEPATPTPTNEPPTPTPTREPARQSIRRDPAVQEAWELIERMESEGGAGTQEYKEAVSNLKGVWTKKYENAVRDFEAFEEQTVVNQQIAESYLQVQENLTAEIPDPELRALEEANDQEQRLWITEYQLQAGDVLTQAKTIKLKLDSMTIILEKTELTAYLPREIHTGFTGLPQSLTSLDSLIDRFKERSDRIRANIRGERIVTPTVPPAEAETPSQPESTTSTEPDPTPTNGATP